MTTNPTARPNRFVLALGTFMSGAGLMSWFALFHYTDKWKMSGPNTPGGAYIYAHVEHGGVTYFDAMQSTASHLYMPVWIFTFVGILIANAAYGENAFRRRQVSATDMPMLLFQIAGAAIAAAVIYLFGHDILNALISSPFGPSGDDLSMVDPK